MADDHTQRPYRSSDTIARAPAPAKPAGSTGSDPLAELARLIGQNDPFSEYGRAQAAAQQPQAAPAVTPTPQYDFTSPGASLPAPDSHVFAQPNFARQPFGGAPLAAGSDLYQVGGNEHAFPAAAQDGGYEDDGYHPTQAHPAAENADFYEDVPPKGRRMGVMLVAGIFALAVVGSAGAFGYRALFGKSGASAPPPVIKADTAPNKIVPASTRDATSNKAITDRVNGPGESEKLVSREEQPVDIKDKAAAAFPPMSDQAGASTPVQGSGVVSPDAKRVRTISIRPDQSVVADATPAAAPQAAVPRVTNIAPAQPAAAQPPVQQVPPPRAADTPPTDVNTNAASPAPKKPAAARVPPAVAQHQASVPANAPLSLSPDAPARPAPRAAKPMRTASAPPAQSAPAAASGASGSYAVQVSSQRSEAEAQAAFRSLQGKYPAQLGGKQAMIHKVDLGAKGIYYRAMVGPFATGSEATELCSSLKAAGGTCLIQRN